MVLGEAVCVPYLAPAIFGPLSVLLDNLHILWEMGLPKEQVPESSMMSSRPRGSSENSCRLQILQIPLLTNSSGMKMTPRNKNAGLRNKPFTAYINSWRGKDAMVSLHSHSCLVCFCFPLFFFFPSEETVLMKFPSTAFSPVIPLLVEVLM